jgi:hypothetical protein
MPRADRAERTPHPVEHCPENALDDPSAIGRFYDLCSDPMRELLDMLAAAPDSRRTFPEVEDAIGWPRRRLASVLGGVWQLRTREFAGGRPYRLISDDQSASGRWEIWCDAQQAEALRDARTSESL